MSCTHIPAGGLTTHFQTSKHNRSHTLTHLASYESPQLFNSHISAATQLKQLVQQRGMGDIVTPDARTEETRGGCLSSRPMAQFHSERHAASKIYEMEPHNQIEKPQCRTV